MSLAILTITGIPFWFDCPEEHPFYPFEIAGALSKLCRYTGHCNQFYSVAQHSVLVAQLVPPQFKLEALLHDASEAYLGDIASPLKQLLPEYKAIEARVQGAIREHFFLPKEESPEVKAADMQALEIERYCLMPVGVAPAFWPRTMPETGPLSIIGLPPDKAHDQFMAAYAAIIQQEKPWTSQAAKLRAGSTTTCPESV